MSENIPPQSNFPAIGTPPHTSSLLNRSAVRELE